MVYFNYTPAKLVYFQKHFVRIIEKFILKILESVIESTINKIILGVVKTKFIAKEINVFFNFITP